MKKSINFTTWAVILFILSACNFPGPGQSNDVQTRVPGTTATPEALTESQGNGSGECGFMWANERLPELSDSFQQALQNIIPNAQGYAQAYGENCVAETGEVVRFLAMETDFFITIKVQSLEDKQALGELIARMMEVLAEFPTDETPGPQPGYVGITFETDNDSVRLWVMRSKIEIALEDGIREEELFNSLQTQ